jgi:hypothetical protein
MEVMDGPINSQREWLTMFLVEFLQTCVDCLNQFQHLQIPTLTPLPRILFYARRMPNPFTALS